MTRIQIDGRITEDQDDILNELVKFYSVLFTSAQAADHQDFLENLSLPQVTSEDKDILEQLISLQEVEIAIKQLNVGKCPGLDGLPIEFYQIFLDSIKYSLHSLFLNWIDKGLMCKSARQGTISLLEKIRKGPVNNYKLETPIPTGM